MELCVFGLKDKSMTRPSNCVWDSDHGEIGKVTLGVMFFVICDIYVFC
jgi:hypothetical protein